VEGMFDEDKKLLGAWCYNDAEWRGEYMNGFIKNLGFVVVQSYDNEMRGILREHFGLSEEE
jgi:hypothetical protein